MPSFLTPRRDKILTAMAPDAELQLHSGDPGPDGTANVILQADVVTPVVRKPVTFGPIADAAGGGRQVVSDVAVSWAGTEIPDGRTISHVTVWKTAVAGGDGEMGGALAATKITGTDGVTFEVGDVTMKVV